MRVAPVFITLLVASAIACGPSRDIDSPDAGHVGSTCTPKKCADFGANCGSISDGCGGSVECGTCSNGEVCGVSLPNVCGQPAGNGDTEENTDARCSDGISNDGDKYVDCDDFDCSKNAAVTVCGGNNTGAENTDALCSDGVSNDGDNFIDCDDFDCSKNPQVTVCGGGGGGGTIDRVSCTGTSEGSGALNADTSVAAVRNDEMVLVLSQGLPNQAPEGAIAFQTEFPFQAGVYEYPVGSVACALIQKQSGSWKILEVLSGCEVVLGDVTFSDASDTCNGTFDGAAIGYRSNFTAVGGGFETPFRGTESDFAGGCRGTDMACSSSSDCCSGSCSLALGVCN